MKVLTEFLFSVGLFINALLFVPQILVLIREQHSKDLSLITFGGFCLIQFFTIVHGFYHHDILLILGYVFSFLACGTVTTLAIYYRVRPGRKGS